MQIAGHIFSTSLDKLRPFTQYKARIKATNDLGTGNPSNVIAVSASLGILDVTFLAKSGLFGNLLAIKADILKKGLQFHFAAHFSDNSLFSLKVTDFLTLRTSIQKIASL